MGISERRFVGRPVEALSVRGSKAFLFSVNTKVVDSVRVLEELRVSRVLLHVAPATALPPAWHKVQVVVHGDLMLTHIHAAKL